MRALFLLAAALAAVSAADLGEQYVAAINHAESLYKAGKLQAALLGYELAHGLVPTEPGGAVGIGWSLLKMGLYPEAESVFRQVLADRPLVDEARQGLAALPLRYRYKLTLSGSVAPNQGSFLTGFVEYNHGLAQILLRNGGQNSGPYIGAPPCRVAHHKGNRLGWISQGKCSDQEPCA